MRNAQNSTTLLQWTAPDLKVSQGLLAVILGSVLLTVSAKIQVPFWPVPMTMQTFAVLVIGMAFGSRLGALTVAAYLGQGLVGLPVFAGAAAGPAYFAGPTAGYLVGFVASAWLIGTLAERGWDRSVVRCFAAMAIGHAVIFMFGLGWLTTIVGLEKAFAAGLYPFWAATILKTLLGACTMQGAWYLIGKRQR